VSILPHRSFEFGVQVIDEMGGNGAPPASFGDRFLDIFPLIDIFRSSDFLFSNKMAGAGFRWRVPSFAGFQFYTDAAIDDFDVRRVRSSMLEDGGYVVGFSFSCFAECGRYAARAEYRQTGIRYYTHTQFSTGIAKDDVVLGDPLGPRGLGSYVSLDLDDRLGTFSLGGAYEVRSGNRYGSVANDEESRGFRFVLMERHPGEHRVRATIGWTSPSRLAKTTARLDLGVERVSHFAFRENDTRTNVLARLQVEVRP
jgi:hypothetical protein